MTDDHERPFPWRLMGLVALIVVLATVVAGIALSRNSVQEDPVSAVVASGPATLPVEERRQLTLLLQVRDREEVAVSTVLLGVGGGTSGVAQLLIPRTLLLPTVPAVQVQDVGGPSDAVGIEAPIETLLGVNVDAVLDLDRLAWVGLLDSLGGAVDPERGSQPGSFPLVLERVLAGLPGNTDDAVSLLISMGSMARSSVTSEDAALLLVAVRQAERTQLTRRAVLPVTTVRSGSAAATVISQPEADAVVRELFPEALLQPGHRGQARVVIDRAGATVGAEMAARLVLVENGFGVTRGWSAGVTRQDTAVFVPSDDPVVLERGSEVAAALGLSPDAVRVDRGREATVDVRIELGTEYQSG